jgi:large subunit ribosomal protein L29
MPGSELAGMETGELEDRLSEARRELFNLRFQRATGQLDNTARLGQVRREVARALTYLRQRELGIDEGPPPLPVAPAPGGRAERRAGRGRRREAGPEELEDEIGEGTATASGGADAGAGDETEEA